MKFFRNLPRIIKIVEASRSEQTARGLVIVQEEFDALNRDLIAKSILTQPFEGLKANVTIERDANNHVKYTVSISDMVWNLLDDGIEKVPRYAKDYGLKVFKLYAPRSPRFESGNRPMSQPNSTTLQTAVSNVERDKFGRQVIYRPVIRVAVPPRNWTVLVAERAKQRIREEGVQVGITILKVESQLLSDKSESL